MIFSDDTFRGALFIETRKWYYLKTFSNSIIFLAGRREKLSPWSWNWRGFFYETSICALCTIIYLLWRHAERDGSHVHHFVALNAREAKVEACGGGRRKEIIWIIEWALLHLASSELSYDYGLKLLYLVPWSHRPRADLDGRWRLVRILEQPTNHAKCRALIFTILSLSQHWRKQPSHQTKLSEVKKSHPSMDLLGL